MREPSAEARYQQEAERIQQKALLVKTAWKRSEWVLNILRTKSSNQQTYTDEQILQWARQQKII